MFSYRLPVHSLGATLCTFVLWKFRVYLSPLFIRHIDEIEATMINGFNILFHESDMKQEVVLSILVITICIVISAFILSKTIELMKAEASILLTDKIILVIVALICIINLLFSLYMILFLILLILIGIALLLILPSIVLAGNKSVHVRGHYRNGSYVRSHYRSRPRKW